MFEADRLLKCLDKGTDNITKNPVRATVAGYVPLLERIQPAGNRLTQVWHRFWFVIEKVELKHDPTRGSLAFGDVRLRVLTETEMDGHGGSDREDPLDAEFCRHITEHYDEYAKDFPILSRLKELAKIAAIAKFICSKNLPVDLAELFLSLPHPVATPDTTPGISVASRNIKVEHSGNIVRTHTVSLFGGVDIDPSPVIQPDDGDAARLRTLAEKSRSSPSVGKWAFSQGNVGLEAQATRLGAAPRPLLETCDDHVFIGREMSDPLRVRRVYESASFRKGDFGPGWFLWLPYSLSVVAQHGKRAEVLTAREGTDRREDTVLVLHDYRNRNSSMLRHIPSKDSGGQTAYCKVESQTFDSRGVAFHYDPSFVVYHQGANFQFTRGGLTFVFDGTGNLQQVFGEGGILVSYERSEGRIRRILGLYGRRYEIEYEASGYGPRIANIAVSDGHFLRYQYDNRECLARWIDGSKEQEYYGYDTRRRLTERRNVEGKVIGRSVYDDFGCVVPDSDTIATPSGNTIRRWMDHGRLVQIRDERGSHISYRYDAHGNLSDLKAGSDIGTRWEMSFDAMGRLSGFLSHSGLRWMVSYDCKGNVDKVSDPRGGSRVFEWGDGSRLLRICDHIGRRQSAEYDATGRLRNLTTSTGAKWAFDYDGGSVLRVNGSLGRIRSKATESFVDVKTRSTAGVQRRCTYDLQRGCLTTKSSGRAPSRVEYDAEARAVCVRTEAGSVQYQTHEGNLTVEIQFTHL